MKIKLVFPNFSGTKILAEVEAEARITKTLVITKGQEIVKRSNPDDLQVHWWPGLQKFSRRHGWKIPHYPGIRGWYIPQEELKRIEEEIGK